MVALQNFTDPTTLAILKVQGKSVGYVQNVQRERINCTSVFLFLYGNHLWKFQPKRTHISWDMNENISKENKNNSGFGQALQ